MSETDIQRLLRLQNKSYQSLRFSLKLERKSQIELLAISLALAKLTKEAQELSEYSLKIAEDPKQILLDMMTSFSETMWSARWCSGLEFILWKKVRECSDDLSLRKIADFNFYAGLAGGWWMWDENQKSEVFVTFAEWLEIYSSKVNE